VGAESRDREEHDALDGGEHAEVGQPVAAAPPALDRARFRWPDDVRPDFLEDAQAEERPQEEAELLAAIPEVHEVVDRARVVALPPAAMVLEVDRHEGGVRREQ